MAISRQLQEAIRDWEQEVNDEAIRQIEQGVPPFTAIDRARDIVGNRRKTKASRSVTHD